MFLYLLRPILSVKLGCDINLQYTTNLTGPFQFEKVYLVGTPHPSPGATPLKYGF